jgi:predicted RNase H-like HicB family nuclease
MTTLTRRETDALKSTYDEALAIKEAWDVRIAKAEAKLRGAMAAGTGIEAARRNTQAVAIQHAEAVAHMGTALDTWLDAVDTIRHRAAVLALSAQNTHGRLHARGRH